MNEPMEIKKASIAGDKNPRWKGGQIVTKDGRVMIHSPNHPSPSKGRYVYRYRLAMEAHLGRFLAPEEVVHHKNGQKNDDRLENLELISNLDHSVAHAQENRSKYGWAKGYEKCVGCGTTEAKHKGHGLCTRCTDKKRWPGRGK